MEPLRMDSRGLEALATSDGLPEKIVDAQPQSASTSFTVACSVENDRWFLEATS